MIRVQVIGHGETYRCHLKTDGARYWVELMPKDPHAEPIHLAELKSWSAKEAREAWVEFAKGGGDTKASVNVGARVIAFE